MPVFLVLECSGARGRLPQAPGAGRAESVPTDAVAAHVARLGLTRRQLAAELGVSLGSAQALATSGQWVTRALERRALERLA
jgi:hypothetical protein